ncbi:MAG: trifunctional transcriptional activator/DNA repair protein Ada/methylated-DNA--[protein]-cysteine S-methyltransferase [Beijerinckiaceae bacterium]|nr:trifunctional transcriptional activator/DNA repair protein Ada/methylated-DNA--[protein]-cysteine S-methyltransferase [Beijerinckiaceae bacterium]
MLFRPNDDALYAALLARDPSHEGRVFACVKTTGIFCRLTCAARKPFRRNVVFHDSVSACVEDGFKPCKRCKPLQSASETDPTIEALIAALEANPSRRWREDDLVRMKFDPSTVRRLFRRRYGITFLDLARRLRLRRGAEALASGRQVIDAQLDAGFESASGFRIAFARLLGVSPANFTGNEALKADWIDTPIGSMIAVASERALHLLEFFDRKALPIELKAIQRSAGAQIGIGQFPPIEQVRHELAAYFKGEACRFDTRLQLTGQSFQRLVWAELMLIRPGDTRSYATLAILIGRPSAVRAVARANGANRIGIIIPCHRVIGSDGSLTGYGGGIWRKQWLLEHERKYFSLGLTVSEA